MDQGGISASSNILSREAAMSGRLLNRFLRLHCRTLAVCAMIPLTVFNGQTLVGCGCSGQFEAVCHCHMGGTAKGCCGSCCGGHGSTSCPCCSQNKTFKDSHSGKEKASDTVAHFGTHPCRSIAVHDVIPATVVHVYSADDCEFATLTLDTHDLSFNSPLAGKDQFVELDLKVPPNDLVVTLHRFII